MNDLKLIILDRLYKEAICNYDQYKRAQDKILAYAASIFISIITITGVFVAVDQGKVFYHYAWYHIVIFHTIFFILYLFYTTKLLRSETFKWIAFELEYAMQKHLKLGEDQIVHVMRLKAFILGKPISVGPLKSGINPGKIANVMIFCLYTFISLGPYVILEMSNENARLSIGSNIWILIITLVYYIAFWLIDKGISKKRKDIRQIVRKMVQYKLNNLIKSDINAMDNVPKK